MCFFFSSVPPATRSYGDRGAKTVARRSLFGLCPRKCKKKDHGRDDRPRPPARNGTTRHSLVIQPICTAPQIEDTTCVLGGGCYAERGLLLTRCVYHHPENGTRERRLFSFIRNARTCARGVSFRFSLSSGSRATSSSSFVGGRGRVLRKGVNKEAQHARTLRRRSALGRWEQTRTGVSRIIPNISSLSLYVLSSSYKICMVSGKTYSKRTPTQQTRNAR